MMDVDFLPHHLIIVGGSYIGLDGCHRVQAATSTAIFAEEDRMDKTVDVIIPVEPEAAAALADARNREAVGRLVSRVLRPRAGPSPLAQAIAELKAEARAVGLSDGETLTPSLWRTTQNVATAAAVDHLRRLSPGKCGAQGRQRSGTRAAACRGSRCVRALDRGRWRDFRGSEPS